MLADGHARSDEARQQHLFGRPGIRRGLQHHELSRTEDAGDVGGRRHDVRDVGLLGLGERGRHADHDNVGLAERLGRPPHDQALVLNETRQHVIGHVLDGARAATQPLDPVRVGIDADHREARLGERHGQRQPHVPQPDHADDRRACLDSLTELGSDRVHLATVRARPREAAASPRA